MSHLGSEALLVARKRRCDIRHAMSPFSIVVGAVGVLFRPGLWASEASSLVMIRYLRFGLLRVRMAPGTT